VGDRGMIKGPQMEEVVDAGFQYITAITKPQIETLLARGEIQMELFDETLAEASKLDGCYCLTTDLTAKQASKETVHDRYKSLAQVESAFRTSKTGHLELRPIHVRLERRTRGHAFVVMLAYRLVMELAGRWRSLDVTVEEGLHWLSTLCAMEVQCGQSKPINQIPAPRDSISRLLAAAGVSLPAALPHKGVRVSTKKKLTSRRK